MGVMPDHPPSPPTLPCALPCLPSPPSHLVRYVGGMPGKIDLYVGKEVVKRAVPMDDACGELVKLIKDNGRWVGRVWWVGRGNTGLQWQVGRVCVWCVCVGGSSCSNWSEGS